MTLRFTLLTLAAAAGFAQAPAPAPLAEKWGIEVTALRTTAAGMMIDFRFRVLDPIKSAPLFRRDTRPHLVDEASGSQLEVPNPPKVGRLRSTNAPETNRVYGMIFGNVGRRVKPGNKVTVVIGDFRAEHLVVEGEPAPPQPQASSPNPQAPSL